MWCCIYSVCMTKTLMCQSHRVYSWSVRSLYIFLPDLFCHKIGCYHPLFHYPINNTILFYKSYLQLYPTKPRCNTQINDNLLHPDSIFLMTFTVTRVTLYTAGLLHTAVPHCWHSRAPIVHTAVPRENNEHGCVYLRCTAVCKLPGCVEDQPWVSHRRLCRCRSR